MVGEAVNGGLGGEWVDARAGSPHHRDDARAGSPHHSRTNHAERIKKQSPNKRYPQSAISNLLSAICYSLLEFCGDAQGAYDDAFFFAYAEEFVVVGFAEGGEVVGKSGIAGSDFEYIAGGELFGCLFDFDDGTRAAHASAVEKVGVFRGCR